MWTSPALRPRTTYTAWLRWRLSSGGSKFNSTSGQQQQEEGEGAQGCWCVAGAAWHCCSNVLQQLLSSTGFSMLPLLMNRLLIPQLAAFCNTMWSGAQEPFKLVLVHCSASCQLTDCWLSRRAVAPCAAPDQFGCCVVRQHSSTA